MVKSILSSCDDSTYVSDSSYELIDNLFPQGCPSLRNDEKNVQHSKTIYCIIKNKIISLVPSKINKYSKPKFNCNIKYKYKKYDYTNYKFINNSDYINIDTKDNKTKNLL